MDLVTTQSESTTQLFAGDFPRVTKAITILASVGALVVGTILGKITKGAVSSAAKTGGNTGNGTLTLDETTPKLANAIAGVYKVRIIRAAVAGVGTTPAVPAMAAIAELKDPTGKVIDVFDLPTTPGIVISNQVKFTMLEGSSAFVLGDGFDVTIAAGSGKYKPYDDDNVDGSEVAELVLAEAIASSDADVNSTAYQSGHFNSAALTGFDASARVDFAGTPIFIGTIV